MLNILYFHKKEITLFRLFKIIISNLNYIIIIIKILYISTISLIINYIFLLMGICIQKNSQLKIQTSKMKSNTIRESFLLNSFTFDPTFQNSSGFFFFDLANYCEIQYILRKSKSEEQGENIITNLEQHIKEIQNAINKFQQANQENLKTNNDNQNKQTKNSDRKIYKFDSQLDCYSQINQKQMQSSNNILNFELVGVNVNNCQDMQDLPFQIFLNNKKVASVMGTIVQNKWYPTSSNQISIYALEVDLSNSKKQSNIKITSRTQNQIQCTIPLNQITFKYIIPVLQTSNIRNKQDNQPAGHIHFKIEYVGQFETHKLKVIKDLKIRKQGLQDILQKIADKESGGVLDKTLQIQQNADQSYRSSKLQ